MLCTDGERMVEQYCFLLNLLPFVFPSSQANPSFQSIRPISRSAQHQSSSNDSAFANPFAQASVEPPVQLVLFCQLFDHLRMHSIQLKNQTTKLVFNSFQVCYELLLERQLLWCNLRFRFDAVEVARKELLHSAEGMQMGSILRKVGDMDNAVAVDFDVYSVHPPLIVERSGADMLVPVFFVSG